jgi:hypothetical protein
MHVLFVDADLDSVVADSKGFSFAQLREAYIMAGQLAFEGNREICAEDLSSGVLSLLQTIQLSSKRNNRAGDRFESDDAAHPGAFGPNFH